MIKIEAKNIHHLIGQLHPLLKGKYKLDPGTIVPVAGEQQQYIDNYPVAGRVYYVSSVDRVVVVIDEKYRDKDVDIKLR